MEGATRPSGTVTFLFTDIEGSTSLWEQHPTVMSTALARHDQLVRKLIAEYGGYVFSTAGDAFSSAFTLPTDAVRAALALQETIEREPWPDPISIRIRMGLHTGTAEEREGDYFGPTLNRAARVMGAAHGGEVLASTATMELVRALSRQGVTFVDLGLHELAGIGPERLLGVVGPDRPQVFAPRAPLTDAPTRLPLMVTSFIGRELELVELTSALAGSRLITLVGPGGVGKTRLAIEAGWAAENSFSDGVWFANLAPIREHDAVAHALVTALEVRPVPGRTPLDALSAGLRGQHRLVVVDNCEHLLGDIAIVLRRLVNDCPTLSFLATSRAPLAIAGERVWPLAPLPTAGAAVALFCDRARAVDSSFVLGAISSTVEVLCERLDGMPLAIELAAARSRTMTPTELLAHLGDRFRLLRSTRRDADDRHATLQATVDWSYQLLDEKARLVFDRLGVFAAAADLTAVVAVVGDETLDELDILDAITTLVDHSLVVAERDGPTTRFRLLDTMRAYANDRLAARDAATGIAHSHGEWAAARVTQLNELLLGPDPNTALSAVEDIERLWPDLRAAMSEAIKRQNTDLAARLVGSFGIESLLRERDELRSWAAAVLDLPEVADHPLASDLFGLAATLEWHAGQFETMSRLIAAGEALPGSPLSNPTWVLASAKSLHLTVRGELQLARQAGEDLLDRIAARGPADFGVGWFATMLLLNDCYTGQPQRALTCLDASPAYPNPLVQCFQGWVRTAALLDIDASAAIPVGRQTIEFARRIRATWIVDTVSNYLTAALVRAGEASQALDTMRSVLAHTGAGGGVQSLGNTVRSAIVLFTRLGHDEVAAVLSGWLTAQHLAIPGTAGMRAHAAESIESLAASLGASRLAIAQSRGARLSVPDVVGLLVAELERASSQRTV